MRPPAPTSSTRPAWATAEIRAVCDAVETGKRARETELSFAEIAEAGAQRVSVGGSLDVDDGERPGRCGDKIRDRGDFSSLGASSRLHDWLG